MSIAALVRGLAAAGAPPEAIALAVEAVEAARAQIDEARVKARDKKRAQRAAHGGDTARTVPGHSRDRAGTVPESTPAPAPFLPPDPLPTPTHTPGTEPRARKGSVLPSDFTMPDDWIEWAMAERSWPRTDAESEANSFHDHWIAKPGAAGRKCDWQATWRNWVRNSRRNGRNGHRHHDKPSAWAARPGMAGQEPFSLDD